MRDRVKAQGLLAHAQTMKDRVRALDEIEPSALAPRSQRHLRCMHAEIEALQALAAKLL